MPEPARPSTMRAVVARRYGTAEVVEIDDIAVPTPGPTDVLIEVAASSLNALDWHFLTGTPYLIRPTSGLRRPTGRVTPGADVCGTVVAIGEKVDKYAVGDVVFGECEGGGCAPYLVTGEDNVVLVPDGVSTKAVAATPVAGLTALQGLRTEADLRPGEEVLINGAAGGVGTFAVQIAKAMDARVTAVCSARNVDMVRSLGADTVVAYDEEDFVPGGPRFDVMLDNVGNRSPIECRSVLKADGRYVAISGPKENRWFGPVGHIARAWFTFRRSSQSFHQFTASPNHDDLTFLGELLADGRLEPEIDRVIGLDDVAAGLAEIGTGHTRAKIVVTLT
ncbi:MAG: NAD(P)-dependent alcohol dehydrogenase [Acidimicrobiales bacterium]